MTEFQKWVEDCYDKSNIFPDKDRVKRMYMNPKTFANFRDWDGLGFDPYNMREMIVTFGHYGIFWGPEHREPDCVCGDSGCDKPDFDKGVIIIGLKSLEDNAMVVETDTGVIREFKLELAEREK